MQLQKGCHRWCWPGTHSSRLLRDFRNAWLLPHTTDVQYCIPYKAPHWYCKDTKRCWKITAKPTRRLTSGQVESHWDARLKGVTEGEKIITLNNTGAWKLDDVLVNPPFGSAVGRREIFNAQATFSPPKNTMYRDGHQIVSDYHERYKRCRNM